MIRPRMIARTYSTRTRRCTSPTSVCPSHMKEITPLKALQAGITHDICVIHVCYVIGPLPHHSSTSNSLECGEISLERVIGDHLKELSLSSLQVFSSCVNFQNRYAKKSAFYKPSPPFCDSSKAQMLLGTWGVQWRGYSTTKMPKRHLIRWTVHSCEFFEVLLDAGFNGFKGLCIVQPFSLYQFVKKRLKKNQKYPVLMNNVCKGNKVKIMLF